MLTYFYIKINGHFMGITKVKNSNLVSNFKIYNIAELAETLKVSTFTILLYIRDGLICVDDNRQHIWGKELKRYAECVRRRRVKAEHNQMNCVKCKKPTEVWGNAITIKEYPEEVNKNNLYKVVIQGICSDCGTVCTKITWSNHLHELYEKFTVVDSLI